MTPTDESSSNSAEHVEYESPLAFRSAICGVVLWAAMAAQCVLAENREKHSSVIKDTVDTTEIQRVYDENAKHFFTQSIFWEGDYTERTEHVRDWRIVKNNPKLPQFNHDTRKYDYVFFDGSTGEGPMRHVSSSTRRNVWSQVDNETQDRLFFSAYHRRGLTTRPFKKTDGQ